MAPSDRAQAQHRAGAWCQANRYYYYENVPWLEALERGKEKAQEIYEAQHPQIARNERERRRRFANDAPDRQTLRLEEKRERGHEQRDDPDKTQDAPNERPGQPAPAEAEASVPNDQKSQEYSSYYDSEESYYDSEDSPAKKVHETGADTGRVTGKSKAEKLASAKPKSQGAKPQGSTASGSQAQELKAGSQRSTHEQSAREGSKTGDSGTQGSKPLFHEKTEDHQASAPQTEREKNLSPTKDDRRADSSQKRETRAADARKKDGKKKRAHQDGGLPSEPASQKKRPSQAAVRQMPTQAAPSHMPAEASRKPQQELPAADLMPAETEIGQVSNPVRHKQRVEMVATLLKTAIETVSQE